MKLMSIVLQHTPNNKHYEELSRLIIKTAIKTFELQKKDIDDFAESTCPKIAVEMENKLM